MPAAAPLTSPAAPLTFPAEIVNSAGRVYTSFRLGASPVRPGAPVYRTVTKTDISNWTF